MKIRNGFVSNSSSSSFIITDKNNFEKVKDILKDTRRDYYIFKDVLYTSSVCEDELEKQLTPLASDTLDCELGGRPYGDYDEYVEIDGEIGRDYVYIPREACTDEDLIKFGQAPYWMSSKLYLACKNYFDNEEEKTDDDRWDFFNKLRAIYNYEDEEE